jgi:rRNA maturation RNase YbeY
MAVLDADTMTVSSNGTLPRVPFLALKEKILGKKYELSIRFVAPAEAQALNMAHRNKDYVPNTLSFPLSDLSGEIILCRSAIRKEYKNFGMEYDQYLLFIVIHSMLHLKGYEHGSTMERKERSLLSIFS